MQADTGHKKHGDGDQPSHIVRRAVYCILQIAAMTLQVETPAWQTKVIVVGGDKSPRRFDPANSFYNAIS